MSTRASHGSSPQSSLDVGSAPTRRIVAGEPYLLPPAAYVTVNEDGEQEVRGAGIIAQPDGHGDLAVLAVPADPSVIDRFVPTTSIRTIYHLVHTQKWAGVLVPHDTHTQAAARGEEPYVAYAQAVTFAKVTGEMRCPATSDTVSCAVLNVRMPRETYGGQLWWLIGGHNVPHTQLSTGHNGADIPGMSSLGGTLRKEGEEEAFVIRTGRADATPFNPRERGTGRRLQVLGYGRSSDTVGRVHESVVVVVHLARGERLVVRERRESLGFIRVPLAEWLRFMQGEATLADERLIRAAVVQGLEDELMRVPVGDRGERRTMIDSLLTAFFGEQEEDGERAGFHITPEQNTPPIDRLSLRAAQALAQQWGLLLLDSMPSD